MKGTEKQVTWAKDIRKTFDRGFELIADKISDDAKVLLNEISANDDAAYWIDNRRNATVVGMIKSLQQDRYLDADEDDEERMEAIVELVDEVFDAEYVAYRNATGKKLY